MFGVEVSEHPCTRGSDRAARQPACGNPRGKERRRGAWLQPQDLKQKGPVAPATARSARLCSSVVAARTREAPGWARRPSPRSVAALKSALSLLVQRGALTWSRNFELTEIKTKALAQVLEGLQGLAEAHARVDGKENDKLRLSMRNLNKNLFLPPEASSLRPASARSSILSKDAVEKWKPAAARRPHEP